MLLLSRIVSKGSYVDLMASNKHQLKISVEPDLAESFKTACLNAGVSMVSEISEFMAEKTNALVKLATKSAKQDGYETRRKRRRHLGSIILQLEAIKDFEDDYRSNIPENLQTGPAYENAEQAVDNLEQAIDLLKDTY